MPVFLPMHSAGHAVPPVQSEGQTLGPSEPFTTCENLYQFLQGKSILITYTTVRSVRVLALIITFTGFYYRSESKKARNS